METITAILNKYNTDKNESFHNYGRQYEKVFADYRLKPVSVLEIGVNYGESLRAWKDIFPHCRHIVGLDINPDCKQYQDLSQRLHVEILDASQPDAIQYVGQKYGPFDIILDDGSHRNDHVIQSFEGFLPFLNNDGVYVVEDTITYKNPGHINHSYPHHLDYFTRFVPYLNQWRYDATEPGAIRDNCIDPFKIQKKSWNMMECSIDRIEFGCSYIAIYKKLRKHWMV